MDSHLSFSWFHRDKWCEHFFHRNAAMLERVFIVGNVVVVVVGVGEEAVARSKDVGCAHVWRGQEGFVRFLYGEKLLRVVTKILAELVAQVGVGVSVAYYPYGL